MPKGLVYVGEQKVVTMDEITEAKMKELPKEKKFGTTVEAVPFGEPDADVLEYIRKKKAGELRPVNKNIEDRMMIEVLAGEVPRERMVELGYLDPSTGE